MLFILLFISYTFAEPKTVSCKDNKNPVNTYTCTFDEVTGLYTITSTNQTDVEMGPGFNFDTTNYALREKIKIIHFSKYITVIGNSIASNLQLLEKVTADSDSKITKIDNLAFNGCKNLASFPQLSTIKTIGMSAFNNCEKLSAFDFSGVETIGNTAFQKTQITTVTFSSSLKSLGTNVFKDCLKITKFTVTNNQVFSSDDAGALYQIVNNEKRLINYPSLSTTKDLTIAAGCKLIVSNAFVSVDNLQTVNLNEVATVSETSFVNCYKLKKIHLGAASTDLKKNCFGENKIQEFTVDSGNPLLEANDGILYTKNAQNKALVRYPAGKTIPAKYTIPSGVKVIYDYAFAFMTELNELVIEGNDMYSIHSYAFTGCTSLRKITITAPIRSIGTNVFAELNQLTSVVIGNNVKMIGKKMFYKCTALNSVSLGTGILSIESNAFSESSIPTITIPENVKFIMKNAFAKCTKLYSVKIGKSVIEIAPNAFQGCTTLSEVDFSQASSLVRIDSLSFSECHGLKTLIIPPSVLLIGKTAFSKSIGLKTVQFKGEQQPAYCSQSAFDDNEIDVIYVSDNYKHEEFCGIPIKKGQPPTIPDNTPSQNPNDPDKPNKPENKDNATNSLVITLLLVFTLLLI